MASTAWSFQSMGTAMMLPRSRDVLCIERWSLQLMGAPLTPAALHELHCVSCAVISISRGRCPSSRALCKFLFFCSFNQFQDLI